MGKDADQVQTQCRAYQFAVYREESYAVFINEDWRSPFIQYLTKGILPQKHSEIYMLERLTTPNFLHNTIIFKKGYDGDPLRCLGPEKEKETIKEVHLRECGGH